MEQAKYIQKSVAISKVPTVVRRVSACARPSTAKSDFLRVAEKSMQDHAETLRELAKR